MASAACRPVGRAAAPSTAGATREVTCTAGPDGAWFTPDDAVHHYYLNERDGQGRIVVRHTFVPGPDGVAFTADDKQQALDRHTFTAGGRAATVRHFDAPGPDGAWGTGDDHPAWRDTFEGDDAGPRTGGLRRAGGQIVRRMTYRVDAAGHEVQDVEYAAPGPDGAWGTADDAIEKLHRHRFDAAGRRTHSEEYHAAHDGPGPDGRWFSDDDIVSSTKRYLYDDAGRPRRDLKAIGAGPDGAWFSDDDVLQYYVRYDDQPAAREAAASETSHHDGNTP
jgi:hypothetical protein